MSSTMTNNATSNMMDRESLRLEGVTTCYNFDDILDITLGANHAHFDHMIVIGKGSDSKTRKCCVKHNATFVETHLFEHRGRNFNKGAAINQGFGHFQYYGWRLALDVDIMLPDNARRVLMNTYPLQRNCLYHADRVDVIGWKEIDQVRRSPKPQHHHYCIQSLANRPVRERYVHPLYGFVPIGYFQLWHTSEQRTYPHGLGRADHDDVLFALQWAPERRILLPDLICYHVCSKQPQFGENWDGFRHQPRL